MFYECGCEFPEGFRNPDRFKSQALKSGCLLFEMILKNVNTHLRFMDGITIISSTL
jgi:hypothetical protein